MLPLKLVLCIRGVYYIEVVWEIIVFLNEFSEKNLKIYFPKKITILSVFNFFAG